jgi:DNA-binding MarR family transcriptional regulator
MMTAARTTTSELATVLRPALLRLTRLIRIQRVDTSVSLTQLSVLGALEKRGPMTPGELASYERVQPPSMTKVLAGLEEHGLVQRTAHPTDRRQAIIELTGAARELLDSERRSRDAWFSQRLATLSDEERALLRDVLPVLDKLAEL